MSTKKIKRHSEYDNPIYEDIRTIPDFYDNLYPTHQPEGFDLKNNLKKIEKMKNNEITRENDG